MTCFKACALAPREGTVCRGVLPAVSGQFVSHGLRTFAFEGSLTGLKALSGGAAELQASMYCPLHAMRHVAVCCIRQAWRTGLCALC